MGKQPSEVVGGQVARYRHRRAWTQRELADEIAERGGNLARGAVAKIEAGLRAVSVDELVLLAAVLNVSPVALLVPTFDEDAVLTVGDQDLDVTTAMDWMLARRQLRTDEPIYLATTGQWSRLPIVMDEEERESSIPREWITDIADAVARRLRTDEEA